MALLVLATISIDGIFGRFFARAFFCISDANCTSDFSSLPLINSSLKFLRISRLLLKKLAMY